MNFQNYLEPLGNVSVLHHHLNEVFIFTEQSPWPQMVSASITHQASTICLSYFCNKTVGYRPVVTALESDKEKEKEKKLYRSLLNSGSEPPEKAPKKKKKKKKNPHTLRQDL